MGHTQQVAMAAPCRTAARVWWTRGAGECKEVCFRHVLGRNTWVVNGKVGNFSLINAEEARRRISTQKPETQYADLAGFPPEMYQDRSVTILCPSKSAMQSGMGKLGYWKIQIDKRDRWENPLMGWSSTADPLNHVFRSLKFDSKEAAINFAEKHGFEYVVQEVNMKRPMKAKSYSDKFHCLNRKGIPTAPSFTSKQYSSNEVVPGYKNSK